MSRFHSLYTKYENEVALQSYSQRPFPALYREPVPSFNIENYTLQVRIENQLAKTVGLKQLSTLPAFKETRNIYSKAGWTYQGVWKGLSFQTLFSLFSTPQLYPWVRLETVTGDVCVLERKELLNYRIVTECDNQPLNIAYGGPLWVHCFDYYLEYAIPHVKSIILLQGEHQYQHPMEPLGFTLDQAPVASGEYYAIHQEQIIHVDRRNN
jgi:hypothetical protein